MELTSYLHKLCYHTIHSLASLIKICKFFAPLGICTRLILGFYYIFLLRVVFCFSVYLIFFNNVRISKNYLASKIWKIDSTSRIERFEIMQDFTIAEKKKNLNFFESFSTLYLQIHITHYFTCYRYCIV